MGPVLTLKNKVAFITGSTRGIGWSTARFFAKHGATVLLNGVSNKDLLTDRVHRIKKEFGVECEGFLFDVSNPDLVKSCYLSIFKSYKRLDILVNNAGIMKNSLLAMVSSENMDKTFNINVKSTIYNMQYASRLMSRKASGSIINLASIIGKAGSAGNVIYGASKSAVIGLTLSAAKELAPMNIRVNAVAPGFIETDLVKGMPSKIIEETLKNIKMNRFGKPEDVAKAIYFFATDLSNYITGQVLGVDGGMLI